MVFSITSVFVALLLANMGQLIFGNFVKDDGDGWSTDVAKLKKEILAKIKEEIKNEVRTQIKSILKDELEAGSRFVKPNRHFVEANDLSISSLIKEILRKELENGLCERVISDAMVACPNASFNVDRVTSTNDSGNSHSRLLKGGTDGHKQRIQTDGKPNTSGIFHTITKRYAESAHKTADGPSSLAPRATTLTQVAFSVYLDRIINHIPADTTIKFNQVDLNEGNFYNTHTGVFTAPITGLYMFHFEFVGWTRKTELRLMVDDKITANTLVDHEPNTDLIVKASSTTLVKVKAGQSVWVESYAVYDGNVIGQTNDKSSTFFGVLLL